MKALVIGIAALMLWTNAPAASPDESELLKLEADWIRALETKDRKLLDRIVAKEFTFIEPDGTVKTREEYLADRSGNNAVGSPGTELEFAL